MVIGSQWPGWICSGDEINFLWGTNWIPIYDIVEISPTSPCEGGLVTSTAALRVVRGDKKGTQCPGVYLDHPVSGAYKYRGPGPPFWGSLKNWDNKICFWIPWDSDPSRAELARTSSNSKLQTRLLVREGATKYHIRNCPKKISKRKKIGRGSQMSVWHQDSVGLYSDLSLFQFGPKY
jgi:hypothetical protein